MTNNNNGLFGKVQENIGSPVIVQIHSDQFEALQKINKLQEFEMDKEDGLVTQEVIMHELGVIDKKTLANYLSSGKITPDMYTVSPVNGVKKFYWKKILGIRDVLVSRMRRISSYKNVISIRRRVRFIKRKVA